MTKLLWRPSKDVVEEANITRFIEFVNDKYQLSLSDYFELWDWSVKNIPEFWATVWEFVGIKCSREYERVVDDLNKFPGAKWFIGARLNFAENLLRYGDDRTAFIFRNELGARALMSYKELYDSVAGLVKPLKELGLSPGDRVATYMPNIMETPIAMLASTAIGAVWSSCGTEVGPLAAIDRFGQIQPKVLFTVDGYPYKEKVFLILDRVKAIVREVPSIEKVVVVPYLKSEGELDIPNAVRYDEFISREKEAEIEFEQLPAEHPVFIMFTSGTTGKPKCMVQSAAGVLINHLKELILHTDLKRTDVITYITSPSWMMWNWLISSLAVGATIVLYDGNPLYPDLGAMWKIVQEEKVTIFGCSATYINYLRSANYIPKDHYDLSSLREISQTGSPLSSEGFEYVYSAVKRDLWFNSISGGTDINGCFAAGSPTLPVYAGQLQARALGMKVNVYDEDGRQIVDEVGELVCEAPSPSMPICFWGDVEYKKYREAYFEFYPKLNVWRHGDFVVLHSDTRGMTFLGRSDATLKPSGVRIGTAEIYRVLEEMEEVEDSLAVGQRWKGDERIILFVKLKEGFSLTEDLKEKIKRELRDKCSPRHVPAKIFQVPDIPYTLNLKKVEIAVKDIIHGKPITNRGALLNPESLDYFEKLARIEDELRT